MKKIFALLLTVSMLLTAGCSKKVEEIKTVDETQTEVMAQPVEKQDDFAQFRTAELWNDDVHGTVRGEDVDVPIYASLKLPEYTQSVVVEGKRLEFNEEYKKVILKGIFGEEDIYYHDLKHQTTEELEVYLDDRWELFDRYYYADANWKNMEIKKIPEYLKESKSEYTKAADFSVDEYIAKRNGEWYIVEFYVEDGELIIFLQEKEDKIPEGLREQVPEGMKIEGLSFGSLYADIEDLENSCKFSPEEAGQEVFSLAEKLGNSNLVPGEIQHLSCQPYFDETKAPDNTYNEVYGYRVYLDRGVNGERMFGEAVWANVTDEGIIRLEIYNPMDQTRVSEHVSLLSLDKIKAAFKKELTQNLKFYFTEDRKKLKFDTLELLYLWQMKGDTTGEGAYIPVWVLKDTSQTEDVVQVYVNAIDGTVLDKENLR